MEKTTVSLREYQRKFCGAIWRVLFLGDHSHEPEQRCMGVMATGGGKTRCAGALAERFIEGRAERVLFLADTDELVDQANRSLEAVTGETPTIEQGVKLGNLDRPLTVGSIASIGKKNRLERFPRDHFGLIVADECHLAVTSKWQRLFSHFEPAKIVGITATDWRTDRKDLLETFNRLAIRIPLEELIRNQWLAPITIKQVPLEIDVSSVNTKGKGDLDGDELDEALGPYFDAIAESIHEHAQDRKILTFLPLVKTSEAFARACNRHGIATKHIDGDSIGRDLILEEYADNRFRQLCNAMLLTKGYDQPDIDCILILRLTKSWTLYQQMIGRGTRLHDGKRDLLVLDFLWNFGEMMKQPKVMGPQNLMTDNEEDAENLQALIRQGEMLDILQATSTVQEQREQRLMDAIKRKARKRKKARTFDYMSYVAATQNRSMLDFEPEGQSETGKVTFKQANLLRKIGVDPDTIETRGHASMIIGDWFRRIDRGLATVKQLAFMDKLGIEHDPDAITIQQAKNLIDDTLRCRRGIAA